MKANDIRLKNILIGIFGSAIVSFGVYNIHDVADITEGGILGLNLLIGHWFGISPAYTNLILTALCFFIGWRALGNSFIIYSAFFTGAFSVFYRIWEHMPRLFPQLADHPLAAGLLGSLFVGIGIGLSIRAGGAQCGDDAIAMALNRFFGLKLGTFYLVNDTLVMLLSLTYIPPRKILCSAVSVILSGQIIDYVVGFRRHKV